MRGAMELEPELLLQEARENVEAAQSYRRELGHRLEGLREARRQVRSPCLVVWEKRMRNCGALPKRPRIFSWTAYQKYLYWLMCLVYLLSWMTQFLT
ncbi:CRLF3 isoform 2 [Pongo abelii]|uniref:CRLF3 isoform 2 n=1 Tax=Pongo abelii TaxID=9601 RepID=A0A2J8TN89_PONAB|nr:CRLF3 isoform 2 [Pongo abelii]